LQGVPPGQHGPKGKRKISDYGLQLREKQKAKRIYGVMEKQFRNYFNEALKIKGNTGVALITHLERRLDNCIYRLSLSPTRAAARQLIGHGHVLVNNKRMNIPSYQVKMEDVITLKPKALQVPSVKKLQEEKNPQIPAWLERKGVAGKIVRLPERTEAEADINEQLIVEYYSR